ncbi:MAG: hypothetical protein J0M08_12125, partial [Bacteroidetes bacterium]|nr:hypothetical protein [Bacteroidota bacterium]
KSYKRWKRIYNYKEPVALFEKYLQTIEFSFGLERFFNQIFYTSAYTLKRIRTSNSFKEALSKENIELLVLEGLSRKLDSKIGFATLFEEIIPIQVKEEIGKEITLNSKNQKLSTFSDGISYLDYALIDNYFICSTEYESKIENIFRDLKILL